MFDLTLLDQITHRASNLFNRYIWVCAQARVLLAAPAKKNETWTMDFLQDALVSGRKIRTLSIEDAYSREMLAIEVNTPLPALRGQSTGESCGSNADCRCGS